MLQLYCYLALAGDRLSATAHLSLLQCGAVINDHHGPGLKLAPFLRRQYGSAYPLLVASRRLRPVT
jgi:hypothetical protein